MEPEIESKYKKLQSILLEMESVIIGYSGGVDSSLLLKVAVDTLGDRALAIIGKSETYPTSEYEEAVDLARKLNARFEVINTEETDNLKFRENPADRCYYCKTELFSKLQLKSAEHGIKWIADGSIMDDLKDFRPGMAAIKEQRVRSPLLESGFSKNDVRGLSKHLGLPTWDKPSFACLSSRFPYGTGITREALKKINEAESYLKKSGFKAYRARFHDDKTVRIEVTADEINKLLDAGIRNGIVEFMKKLGFAYVTLDLQGYRTGSMNEVLPDSVLKQHKNTGPG